MIYSFLYKSYTLLSDITTTCMHMVLEEEFPPPPLLPLILMAMHVKYHRLANHAQWSTKSLLYFCIQVSLNLDGL